MTLGMWNPTLTLTGHRGSTYSISLGRFVAEVAVGASVTAATGFAGAPSIVFFLFFPLWTAAMVWIEWSRMHLAGAAPPGADAPASATEKRGYSFSPRRHLSEAGLLGVIWLLTYASGCPPIIQLACIVLASISILGIEQIARRTPKGADAPRLALTITPSRAPRHSD
jgi:hypothetical protein